jgi:two-component system, LytTR family, response regulator
MSETIRTLLVDDEPLARDGVRLRLADHPGFQIVGECGNGADAVESIAELRPDVVFLDVQMPGLTGFDVLEELEESTLPTIVFVTAYDQYALRAFEVHALDYLLKPFDDERFAQTVQRLRTRIGERRGGNLSERLAGLLGDLRTNAGSGRGYPDRLVVKDALRIAFVPVDELDWVEADGDYMRLHCRGGKSHLLRRTMAQMERRLDPDRFVRIHRSTLVAVDRIQELRPTFHGEYVVLLRDGTRLKLSRGYRSRLQTLIEETL